MRRADVVCPSRRAGAIVAVMAAASLLTACVQTYPIARAPAGDPIQAARELPDAPDAVRDGEAAVSCGEFALGQGEELPTEAVQCLSRAALADEDAELAWTFPTTEGDPMVYFAFVGDGDDEVTVFTTNAFDSYGGDPGWTKNSCMDVVVATSPLGCQLPSEPGRRVFASRSRYATVLAQVDSLS